MTRRRVTYKYDNTPFFLLALSPFVIFENDYALISSQLCKSHTLWNIFMILGRNVEQDETMCQVQDETMCQVQE